MRVSTRPPRRRSLIRPSLVVVFLISAMLVTTSLIPITTAQKEGKRGAKPGRVDSQVWSKYDQSQVSQSSKWEGDESSQPSELFQVPLSSFKSSKRRASQPPLAVTPNLVATVDVGLESEPNGTSATANALGGTGAKIKGNIFPNGDIDFYSFTAGLGDRVYAPL